MAIKIQKVLTTVPIEIGDVKFDFNVTDESMIKLRKATRSMEEKIKDISSLKLSEEEEHKQVKEIMQQIIDQALGKGVFNKLYKLSPSLNIVLAYYIEVAKEISSTFGTFDISKYAHRFNK